MYNTIKKKLKSIIPEKFLFENELFFRYLYGSFYKGNKHQCNVCNKKIRTFITLKNDDLLCPFCGSLSRNRRLWYLLNKNKDIFGSILHFSPSRNLFRKLKKINSINYYSSDFENEFLAEYNFDITKIKQEENKFNTIICYHILEHVINDLEAMSELYRVLKPNGVVYIQTPYKEGGIYEDFSITSPKEREIHFGQNDHVRIYSIEGLKARLERVGFNVDIESFNEDVDDLKLGFKSPETILIAKK